MKFFRLDLLTLLISLFILGSCKNQNDIGFPPGDQQINGTLVVDDNIIVNTVPEDPFNTNPGISTTTPVVKTPLISFNDNRLGETTTNVAAGIDLPASTTYTLPTGTITTDSAVLELRYADGFYGDSVNSKYKVNVYQLTERPIAGQVYLSNKAWGHGTNLISGNATAFNARPKTIVRVTDIVKGKADTIRKAAPHIRVPISTSFINSAFFGASSSQLATNAAFQAAVKGLYITLQRNQASEAGGALMLNLDASQITVYYRTNNAGTLDTGMVSLPVTPNAHAAEVKHTYTTEVNTALNSTASNDRFYLQGGGLRAKISFPNLESLFGTTDASKIALNRAELIITPEQASGVPYVPLPQLTLYRSDIGKQRQLLPDANVTSQGALSPYYISTALFGGRFDQTKQQYRFVITGYIQNLLNKKLVDYGTYIAPIDTFVAASNTPIPISPTISTAARTIAVGSNKTSPYKIKLNVIYSK